MGPDMRRALTFPLGPDTLAATLDEGESDTGLLIVTGGRQTRVGPQRMMAELARTIAGVGYPVFRFDRRGIGDSTGSDPGYRESGPDIAAAIEAFRLQCPRLRRIVGLGLCDAAAALALNREIPGLDALILLNPWMVETGSGLPAPAAVRAHYRSVITTRAGLGRILRHGFRPLALLRGLIRAFSPTDRSLSTEVISSLERAGEGCVTVLLARGDATARTYSAEHDRAAERLRHVRIIVLDTASHSFAGDQAWLAEQVRALMADQAAAAAAKRAAAR